MECFYMIPVIEAVTTEVTIPSTKETVTIRQMRTKDEKIILTAKAESGNDAEQAAAMLRAIIQVVQNNIVTVGVDVANLAGIDVEWLFVKLRELSVSNKVKTSYRDNEEMDAYANEQAEYQAKTEEKGPAPVEPGSYDFDIELAKIEIKFPDNIQKTIKGNNLEINLRYPPAALYASKPFINATDGMAMLDMLIMKSIVSIKQGAETYKTSDFQDAEFEKFIDDLPIDCYQKIKDFLANMPYLFYEIKYQNKFGHERSIKLTRLTDFFVF